MTNIVSMLEIDVLQITELFEASELAVKNGLPALVVHPGLAIDALLNRMRIKGRFKLIIPVDTPKGELNGVSKFRGISKEALEADGFEIAICPTNKAVEHIASDMNQITEFIKKHLGEFVEVRFIANSFSNDAADLERFSKALAMVRLPSLVRNDTTLKIQHTKANPEAHNEFTRLIKDSVNCPVKISGNIGNIKTTASCQNVSRYGVSLQQAKAIIKEYAAQPSDLKEILTDA